MEVYIYPLMIASSVCCLSIASSGVFSHGLSNNIPWNKPAVYKYYAENDGWDQAKVDHNIFRKAPQANTLNSSWDKTSIM